jgi:histone deacetylase complex regulatory component SIN3
MCSSLLTFIIIKSKQQNNKTTKQQNNKTTKVKDIMKYLKKLTFLENFNENQNICNFFNDMLEKYKEEQFEINEVIEKVYDKLDLHNFKKSMFYLTM